VGHAFEHHDQIFPTGEPTAHNTFQIHNLSMDKLTVRLDYQSQNDRQWPLLGELFEPAWRWHPAGLRDSSVPRRNEVGLICD
jgi:hypothetical protein